MRYIKIIFSLILINLLDKGIASISYQYFIILPLTFLAYSFYVYKSDSNIGSSEAFLIGLFIDLISDSFLGLNAIAFVVPAGNEKALQAVSALHQGCLATGGAVHLPGGIAPQSDQ